jgi:hypothetical protein
MRGNEAAKRMLGPMWRPDQIADIAGGALASHAAELELEQAVHGIDSLQEVEFHPVLAAAFAGAGMGAFREWPFPGEVSRRPKHSERERCDLVLTEGPGVLVDPLAEAKEREALEGTLFEDVGCGMSDLGCGASRRWTPEEALWLEVKLVGQFCYSAGVPGANRTYSSELVRLPQGDIAKLARERAIRHAGLLLILFTADEATAEHDLGVFMHRCLDRELPVGSPSTSRFGVQDRIGNRVCTVALVPVRPPEVD